MDFPIVDLLDDELSSQWLLKQFHPDGLKCPHCNAGLDQAREFRQTKTSQVMVFRCNVCQGTYNLYSRTVFEGRYFRPAQAVLWLRGVTQPLKSPERLGSVAKQCMKYAEKFKPMPNEASPKPPCQMNGLKLT